MQASRTSQTIWDFWQH
jgi:hypothetical protein